MIKNPEFSPSPLIAEPSPFINISPVAVVWAIHDWVLWSDKKSLPSVIDVIQYILKDPVYEEGLQFASSESWAVAQIYNAVYIYSISKEVKINYLILFLFYYNKLFLMYYY